MSQPVAVDETAESVRPLTGVIDEFLGTMILAIVVFAVTDQRNAACPLAKPKEAES